jgi:hypothetical protein
VQAERVLALVRRLAAAAADEFPGSVTLPCHSETPLCQYRVPPPDLGRFDQLLNQGGEDDDRERQHPPAAAK